MKVNWQKTLEKYAGRTCFGGLDLSTTNDFSTIVYMFQNEEDSDIIDMLARVWCPETRLHARENRYRGNYQAWAKQGFLETTPGNAIDYSVMLKRIIEDNEIFNISAINVDRKFQGYQFTEELIYEGIEAYPIGMGAGMAVATREFEIKLLERQLNHGNNPVFRFCADNVAVTRDKNDNISPNKKESQGKIDLIVGGILALDLVLRFGLDLEGNDGSLI